MQFFGAMCTGTCHSVPLSEGNLIESVKIISISLLIPGMSRYQYADIMALLDSLGRLQASSLYRKYRPKVQGISGHASEWSVGNNKIILTLNCLNFIWHQTVK